MMNLAVLLWPFFVSVILGYLAVNLIFPVKNPPSFLIRLFLAGGLGMGFSAALTFICFIFLNRLNFPLVCSLHIAALGILLGFTIRRIFRCGPAWDRRVYGRAIGANILILSVLGLMMYPAWVHANYYPLGGWDAWSVWNFKARFLMLGADRWQNMLEPSLWRTSPHYPLLLPLINVWGWAGVKQPNALIPLLTAIIFTFQTTGLMCAGIRELTGRHIGWLAALLLLSNSFISQIAVSQYCDIVTGYYMLASLLGLSCFCAGRGAGWAYIAALSTGLLAFTKPEGTVAAMILGIIGLAVIAGKNRSLPAENRAALWRPALLLALTLWPAVVFNLAYSPGNQTYINGFISDIKPFGLMRVKMTLAYYLLEFINGKWNGLLVLLTAGVLLGGRKPWRKSLAVFPVFVILYSGVIFVYYQTNTYFDIGWWLQVSLNRIIVSLLPAVTVWMFCGMFEKTRDQRQET